MWQFSHPRYWLYWLVILLLWLISLLPFRLTAFLGRGLGYFLYLIAGRRAHIVRTNLGLCFPELDSEQLGQLMRLHFEALGQSVLTIGINLFASQRRIQKLVTMRNRRYFDDALAAGKPIILLAPHFVAMEIAGLALAPERHMLSMYQTIRNPLIDTLIRRSRSRFGGILDRAVDRLRSGHAWRQRDAAFGPRCFVGSGRFVGAFSVCEIASRATFATVAR